MKETKVNVRELKARLSHYLRLTKAGEAVVITERGVPIGRIVPVDAPVDDRIDAMVRSGLLQWSRDRLLPRTPSVQTTGARTVADVLIEDRG